MENEEIKITEPSGNVFAETEVSDPDKYLVKVELAGQINNIIKSKKLRQADAADILGIDQPKVSALHCGRLDDFSIERLICFLNRLDKDVEILVKKRLTAHERRGRLRVSCE